MTEIIRLVRRFDASVERVFDAWLHPVELQQILLASGYGRMAPSFADARPGGRFVVMEQRDDLVSYSGEYRLIERPTRLVLAFDDELVELSIRQVATGCELVLSLVGASWQRDQWRETLDRLEAIINRDGMATEG